MTALQLHDVTVSRGAGAVIQNVSLSVEPGQITALVGPNGAGKTSLLEAISGVIAVSGGRIELLGRDITRMSRPERFQLGLVHVEQGRAVFPSLTVAENVRLGARNAAVAEEAFSLFPELEPRRNSAAGLLSGGEQQMVVLARSFAAKPRVLLIDEMSLGLAPVVFTRLLPLVTKFAREGVGVLLVEQFTSLALNIANSALVVAGGRVGYSGPATPLVDQPELLRSAYLG